MDEEAVKYLHARSKQEGCYIEGITLNKSTIVLRPNPTTSAVYEELIHAAQYRQGKNDGTPLKHL